MGQNPATAARPAALQEFDVTITETMHKMVKVAAGSRTEAEDIASDNWRTSAHVPGTEAYTGVRIEAAPAWRGTAPGEGHERHGGMGGGVDAQSGADSLPLAENAHVKELFGILESHGRDTSGLKALIGYVNQMEGFVKRAEGSITDMKAQLETMKEVQGHPVKTALQNAVRSLEQKVAEARARLGELKAGIAEGCRNAVAAFKEKGISALNNLASFFGVKKSLQDVATGLDGIIRADDRAIAKIESFAAEYHSAGLHLKNMARVAVGREPKTAAKEAGTLSNALAAPYRTQRAAAAKLKSAIGRTVERLEQLESSQTDKGANRAQGKKPSVLERLAENKERVERGKRDAPAPERGKPQGMEV